LSARSTTSRRAAVAVLALAAGATLAVREWPRWLGRHRLVPGGRYADVLEALRDLGAAARLGSLAGLAIPDDAAIKRLREALWSEGLAGLSRRELASAELKEAGGWVLPSSLVELCSLAART